MYWVRHKLVHTFKKHYKRSNNQKKRKYLDCLSMIRRTMHFSMYKKYSKKYPKKDATSINKCTPFFLCDSLVWFHLVFILILPCHLLFLKFLYISDLNLWVQLLQNGMLFFCLSKFGLLIHSLIAGKTSFLSSHLCWMVTLHYSDLHVKSRGFF